MAVVNLLTVRAELPCLNCETTQTQTLVLSYDSETLELSVVKTCKCTVVEDLETPYTETALIPLTSE